MSKQFFKYLLTSLIIFTSILSLNSCNSAEDANVKHIRVGMNTWPGYEPFMLAKENNYLANSVHISRLDSATDVIKSFKSEIIDIACVTLDEALIYQDISGEDIKIITIMDFSTGGDVVIATKDIKTMKDLKGKVVGVESSALGSFMITRAVDKTDGLNINDINIINISYEHHEKEFINKNVDAVVTFEPVKTKLLKSGAHIIFDSTQIPGEIIDVMIVKTKTLKAKKQEIQALVDAWYKSVKYISTNTKDSMQKMADYEQINITEFIVAFDGIDVPSKEHNQIFFKLKLNTAIELMQRTLMKKHFIQNKTKPSSLYSDEFL